MTPMDCASARTHLLGAQARRLPPDVDAAVRAHVAGCAACARENANEQVLTDLLERRLPQHPASLAFKRRLAAEWPSAEARSTSRSGFARARGWRGWAAAAVAAAIVLIVAVPVYQARRAAGVDRLMNEAVNDHLRMLQPDRAPSVTSSDVHQVKPWFAGRLDFAPVVGFEGDAEFPLKGGTVEYFFDRRAAVFLYGRRLHTASLVVFRPERLAVPARGTDERRVRGFTVIVWRAGDLGYALVSELDPSELRTLAARLGAPA